jgi:hypothetical protein
LHPPYYRGCWHGVSRCFLFRYRHSTELLTPHLSSLTKVLYNPKAFFTHAVWLHQAFAHCAIFPTAASRRSLGRVSVPVWLIILSDQLRIVALVSHYLTNKLIRRRLLQQHEVRRSPAFPLGAYAVLARISPGYPPLLGRFLRVTHPSATRRRQGHPEGIPAARYRSTCMC